MKKFTSILALFCAAAGISHAQDGAFPLNSVLAPTMHLFRVSTSVGYESEYVFRAEKRASHSVQPKVEFSYPVLGFDVYCGAWMNFPAERGGAGSMQELSEVDFYAGANYSFNSFNFDVGFIYYWYTDTPYWMSSNKEAYVGVSFDTSAYFSGINLNPSLYYFYNFDLLQHVVEFSMGYEFPIGTYTLGWHKLTMPMRAYVGWLTADRANGDQSNAPDWHNSYVYAGATLDLAYALTEYCTLSGGIRYSYTTDGDAGREQGYEFNRGYRDQHFWFGAKVDFGF